MFNAEFWFAFGFVTVIHFAGWGVRATFQGFQAVVNPGGNL